MDTLGAATCLAAPHSAFLGRKEDLRRVADAMSFFFFLPLCKQAETNALAWVGLRFVGRYLNGWQKRRYEVWGGGLDASMAGSPWLQPCCCHRLLSSPEPNSHQLIHHVYVHRVKGQPLNRQIPAPDPSMKDECCWPRDGSLLADIIISGCASTGISQDIGFQRRFG